MELELKHLAPYLPYNIRMSRLNKDDKPVIIHMNNGNIMYPIERPDRCKPVLRPMSDFDKTGIAGEKYYSFMSKINEDLPYGFKIDRDLEFDIDIPSFVHCKYAMQVYDFLFENHFDVFGLINQGLAIDINTLKP